MQRVTKPLPLITGLSALLLSASLNAETLETQPYTLSEAGFRFVVEKDSNSFEAELFDLYAGFTTPWNWRLGERWRLNTRLDLSAGILNSEGQQALMVSAGPSWILDQADSRIFYRAGMHPSLVSRHRFGNDDIGGAFQVSSHVGIGVRIGKRWRLGYRFQHTSNGDLYDSNPGLDIHMLVFGTNPER